MNTVVAVDFRAADEERGHDVLPLDLVEAYLRRFVAYPSEHALVAHVLWIAHTHLILCFDTTPRLAFMSAEKMSGKTRALEVTALFVPYPNLSFNASAAALVRVISKGHEDGKIPTILYDEIDNVFGTQQQQDGAGDLKAALNSGYRRGATAMRCTNHGANVAEYFCFAPLAVAGLRTLPDTLASRAIFIHMRRRAPDEEVESFRLRYHPAEAEPIKMALAEWCQEHEDEIRGMSQRCPSALPTEMPTAGNRCSPLPTLLVATGPSRQRGPRSISPAQPTTTSLPRASSCSSTSKRPSGIKIVSGRAT